MRRLSTVLAALALLSLTNCGYNAIQADDEQVKSSWSEVVNQYQRRADLVAAYQPASIRSSASSTANRCRRRNGPDQAPTF